MKVLTKNFFKGFLFLAPIILTGYVFYLVFSTVDSLGSRILGVWIGSEKVLTGLGFLFTLFLFTLTGYLSSIWIGVAFFNWIERELLTNHATRFIYGAIRDTFTAIFGSQNIFSKVVLVDFPGTGAKMVGFITQERPPSFIKEAEEYVLVYFPLSFQFAGYMLVVKKKNTQILDIPPQTALKMIMSAGIVQ